MNPKVYNVLKRLAPPKAMGESFCYRRSPSTPIHAFGEDFFSLVCTLPPNHEGYHVAHRGLNPDSKVLDVWK